MSGFMLLPAKPGTCAFCARDHPAHLPHDVTSLFYGVRFKRKWGVDPTWADACAHLTAPEVAIWRKAMRENGTEWTSPVDREAIREPYAIAG